MGLGRDLTVKEGWGAPLLGLGFSVVFHGGNLGDAQINGCSSLLDSCGRCFMISGKKTWLIS